MPTHCRYLLASILVLLSLNLWCQEFPVTYHFADTAAGKVGAGWPRKFSDREAAHRFINKLPEILQGQGFVAAAIDSVQAGDRAAALWLYLGPQFHWVVLRNPDENKALLHAAGWPEAIDLAGLRFAQFDSLQAALLKTLEEQGFPFGRVWLKELQPAPDTLKATLAVARGPLYPFDTFAIEGVRVRSALLARLTGIKRGQPYDPRRVASIAGRLAALPFLELVQPPSIRMRATGALVQLHLKPRNSNQAQVLLGMQPSGGSRQGSQLTGDARLLLHNSLGGGETIGFSWQRLQAASPRLQLQYDQPFVGGSPLALAFRFDLLRRDSSWLNVQLYLGMKALRAGRRWVGFYYEQRQTVQGAVDTFALRHSRRLPSVADLAVHSLGVQGSIDAAGTFPRRGWALQFAGSSGLRHLRPSNRILALRDADFQYAHLYDTVRLHTVQVKLEGSAAHYQPLGRVGVIKKAAYLGMLEAPSYYTNELFQIGGYRLLRGFATESIFCSHYLIGSIEYRYRLAGDSFFMGFADGGGVKNTPPGQEIQLYWGTGLGLVLQTKAGTFTLAWAVGKEGGSRLDVRQSKLHLGLAGRL